MRTARPHVALRMVPHENCEIDAPRLRLEIRPDALNHEALFAFVEVPIRRLNMRGVGRVRVIFVKIDRAGVIAHHYGGLLARERRLSNRIVENCTSTDLPLKPNRPPNPPRFLDAICEIPAVLTDRC